MQKPRNKTGEDESQYNFVEPREPSELIMCLILAAAYLGLAKYCWFPLLATHNWKLLINVEGFFATISLLLILVGVRPYINPSSLQISRKGLKYLGPYWPRRKTVNWDQMLRLYSSGELIIVLYRPNPKRKRTNWLIIPSIYLAEHEKVPQVIADYSPVKPIEMTNPALISRIVFFLLCLLLLLWLLELMVNH
jgi:hypothetical protein